MIRSLRTHLVAAADACSVQALDNARSPLRALSDFEHVQMDDDVLEADRKLGFFKPVALNAQGLVRVKTYGSSSLKGTRAIAVHKLLQIDTEVQEAVVMSAALGLGKTERGCDQPVLLRTCTLQRELLMKACIWRANPELHYSLPSSPCLLRTPSEKQCFNQVLAPELLTNRGFIVDVHYTIDSPQRDEAVTLLQRLRANDCCEQKGHAWHFMASGQEALILGISLTGGTSAVVRRDAERAKPTDLTTYKLIVRLHNAGWEHKLTTIRKDTVAAAATSYQGGSVSCSGKLFLSHSGRDRCHDSTCVVLLPTMYTSFLFRIDRWFFFLCL